MPSKKQRAKANKSSTRKTPAPSMDEGSDREYIKSLTSFAKSGGVYQYYYNGTACPLVARPEEHADYVKLMNGFPNTPDLYISQLKELEARWVRNAGGAGHPLKPDIPKIEQMTFVLNIIWLVEHGYMENDNMNGYLAMGVGGDLGLPADMSALFDMIIKC